MGKETLDWLARQAGRWAEEDPSPENRAQVVGVIDVTEPMVTKKAQEGDQKSGEFEF